MRYQRNSNGYITLRTCPIPIADPSDTDEQRSGWIQNGWLQNRKYGANIGFRVHVGWGRISCQQLHAPLATIGSKHAYGNFAHVSFITSIPSHILPVHSRPPVWFCQSAAVGESRQCHQYGSGSQQCGLFVGISLILIQLQRYNVLPL
jgi:hypothetical protein